MKIGSHKLKADEYEIVVSAIFFPNFQGFKIPLSIISNFGRFFTKKGAFLKDFYIIFTENKSLHILNGFNCCSDL